MYQEDELNMDIIKPYNLYGLFLTLAFLHMWKYYQTVFHLDTRNTSYEYLSKYDIKGTELLVMNSCFGDLQCAIVHVNECSVQYVFFLPNSIVFYLNILERNINL